MQNQDPSTDAALLQVEHRMALLACDGEDPTSRAAGSHLKSGGSRVRARLALHAATALGRPANEAVAIAAACELLHNASLVHDDLQDRDAVRRGKPAVWREHGDATAICVGDLLLSCAYAALADCGSHCARLIARTHQRVAAVVRGQCADLALNGCDRVSISTYEAVAAGKSGPLLSLPIELALVLAGSMECLDRAVEAGSLFAMAYQMTDDIEDADADALNGELNIVAVLAAAGTANPREAAARLALERFEQARQTALSLPSASGAMLAECAGHRIRAIRRPQAVA